MFKVVVIFGLVFSCGSSHVLDDGRPISSDLQAYLNEYGSQRLHPDVGLNVVEMIQKYGYPCELHEVTTEDGYVLTMQRIPHNKNGEPNQKRPVALLMHGLLSSATDWMTNGPGVSLGYILSDLGYDVWLGNARGNMWSKKHQTLDPKKDEEKFWDFSWHEIGHYDLPAMIDHALKVSGQEKLFYFGHSQGCTTFFVMATTRPEYNKKIQLASMLAPPIYMTNVPNPFLHLIAQFEKQLDWLAHFVGLHEFLPHSDLNTLMGTRMCHEKAMFREVCASVIFLMMGYDSVQLNRTMIPVYMSNVPAGAGIRQLTHYGQGIKTGKFRQFDHGFWKNLLKYGRITPPKYDISKITAPVALYYSSNDLFVNTKDIDELAKEMDKSLVHKHLVPFKLFNHLDFLTAKDVPTLLYDEVIATMERFR